MMSKLQAPTWRARCVSCAWHRKGPWESMLKGRTRSPTHGLLSSKKIGMCAEG